MNTRTWKVTLTTLLALAAWLPPMGSAQISVTGGGMTGTINSLAREVGQFQQHWNQTNSIISTAQSWGSNIRSGADFLNTFSTFAPEDAGLEPNYNPDGMPQVPVHCGGSKDADSQAACQQCYQEAYDELNFVRYTFERLRAIYSATKTYKDKMVAFGDTGASAMGAGGLAWHYEKRGIEESFAKLQSSYKEKYNGLLKTLKRSLEDIAECEAKHYGQSDWYNRYGFMYYTFMEDRYRLAD